MDNANNAALAHGIGAALVIGGLIGLAVGLAVGIFYILSLQKALNRCAPENRAMEPGMVWLLLIPCVFLVRKPKGRGGPAPAH